MNKYKHTQNALQYSKHLTYADYLNIRYSNLKIENIFCSQQKYFKNKTGNTKILKDAHIMNYKQEDWKWAYNIKVSETYLEKKRKNNTVETKNIRKQNCKKSKFRTRAPYTHTEYK